MFISLITLFPFESRIAILLYCDKYFLKSFLYFSSKQFPAMLAEKDIFLTFFGANDNKKVVSPLVCLVFQVWSLPVMYISYIGGFLVMSSGVL